MAKSTLVSVLHNFEFPMYCNVLEVSNDQETIIASGGYKPCIAAFDLIDHTPKFERNIDDEVIRISILGNDWKKLALLHKAGKIEFHSQYGHHHTIELPNECRDMKADLSRGEILTVGKRPSIYRFSTSAGKLLNPLPTTLTSIESISLSNIHSLYALTAEQGQCEFIDARSGQSIKPFNLPTESATASAFSPDGIFLAVGTYEGTVSLFDLRSNTPLLVKDHNYDFPISKISIQKTNVVSLDKKGLKVWDKFSSKTLATVEPDFTLADFTLSQGIVFLGGDSPTMKTFYVPALGPFPKWCSHLEGTTEEMAEAAKETYFDHYRFLTEDQIDQLNLKSEIGRSIKPHMHGYLVPIPLYETKVHPNPI
ncbi:ribosome biogenesis protein ENP2 [Nematocida homosporus]|uniref:ribosome biogenesis protein ENP2 n=1 Tax=Nematocida homosporus TaxID=1912981 RepID=UPI00221F1B23|nr:ribosome biogenesis protein ENP2 [Nematocida homosporus]KAI5185789.1 ribosome biogenesis protein ENP2 [Nematocida homosporus]